MLSTTVARSKSGGSLKGVSYFQANTEHSRSFIMRVSKFVTGILAAALISVFGISACKTTTSKDKDTGAAVEVGGTEVGGTEVGGTEVGGTEVGGTEVGPAVDTAKEAGTTG
jgi:hypothetical protein